MNRIRLVPMNLSAVTLLPAMAILATLVLSAQTAEREHRRPHPRFKLIDLGTLGGPHSYGSISGDGFKLLNNSGVVVSFADTDMPDPNAPDSCLDPPGCLVAHAFRWQDGSITDLGALPGTNSSAAGSINERGWITGESQNGIPDPDFCCFGGLQTRAVLWKHGRIHDVGTFGGDMSLGIYVNDAGQVIGTSNNGVPDPFSLFGLPDEMRTFLWEDGAMRDIGTLGGPDTVPGASCGDPPRNVIVGQSYTSYVPNAATGVPTADAFLWKSGQMTDLGNLGGTFSNGQCANHRGQIIGFSTLAGDLQQHAFFWENGVMTDLGTLGGDNSEAIWLNEAGDVAGSADLPGSQLHDAVLWKHGKIHDLGTLAGDPCSRGRSINARGQVVGGSSDCHNFLRAFLWEEGGPMLDLNNLIPAGSGLQLTNAIDINDRGEILAKSVPLGVTPIDDEDLGHLVLLIPRAAKDNDFDDDLETAADAEAPQFVAPVRKSPSPTSASQPHPTTPRENLAALRARLARQYHLAPKR